MSSDRISLCFIPVQPPIKYDISFNLLNLSATLNHSTTQNPSLTQHYSGTKDVYRHVWETKFIFEIFMAVLGFLKTWKVYPAGDNRFFRMDGAYLPTSKETHSRIFHTSLCSPYHRSPLDPTQMHPKYVLLFGFILILSTNLYLCSRCDRLCKQYDTFLMRNSGYRSLPTQVSNVSTYIAVVVFRVGVRRKENLPPLPSYLYHEHGDCNVSRNIVTSSVYKAANFWSLHMEQYKCQNPIC
jgi:hypothetical protein